MAQNFFADNNDLLFHFRNFDWEEIVRLREDNYTASGAPADLAAALRLYEEKLNVIGELAGGPFAERAAEVDRQGAVCIDHKVTIPEGTQQNLDDLKKAGLCGVTLPRQYGGLFFPVTAYCMMTEIVSRADASLQNLFGLQSIAETLNLFGSEEQKAENLPKFCTGEYDGAMALTEPEAGSDLQSAQVKATLGEDGVWRLNGIKHFITNGMAKMLLVLARSEEGSTDGRGLSMFLAHPCPELTVERIEDKMGIHGSPTCELHFNNAPVELVGKRRFGLIKYVMSLMNGARLAICSQSVGLAEACRQAAWAYCQERKQFKNPISQLPQVREMLTRMDALTAASRSLLYNTSKWVDRRDSWRIYAEAHPDDLDAKKKSADADRVCDALTPMTKAFNTESANLCAYDCIQCHGGKGYMRERPIERYYRDARIMNIYEGTTQMQVVAATAGLLKHGADPAFAEIEAFPFSEEAKAMLPKLIAMREKLLKAQESISAEQQSLLFRRIVRGLTIVMAGELLLRDASLDATRMGVARRFLWEYLPEADMHAEIILGTQGDFSL